MPTIDGDPLTMIADAGLLSEWCEAAAYADRLPNLRSLAAATENWRRTMAGRWRYGASPRNWRTRPLDAVVEGRLVALEEARDPMGAALAELGAWIPHVGDGEAAIALIATTSRGALRAAAREYDTRTAAAVLLRYRIPAAFAPALAILRPEPEDHDREERHE